MSNMYDEGGKGTDLRDQFRQDYSTQQNQIQSRKRSRSLWLLVVGGGILALLLIFGFMAAGSYNTLTTKQEKVKVEFSNVDAQLQRRSDLIPNLVETVKGYAKHEEKVFSDIAEARSRLLNAKTVEEKSAADSQITSALGRLLVLTENYPDLKANEQFKTLMVQLEGTENRIAVARRDYNQIVLDYNTTRQRFPAVVMANVLGFERAEEFKAEEGARKAPDVKFPG
jgi:LemA protein